MFNMKCFPSVHDSNAKCMYYITCTISDISNSSFVRFQIWDFPGQVNFFDSAFDAESIFKGCGALIFVIDAQVCIWCVHVCVCVCVSTLLSQYILHILI